MNELEEIREYYSNKKMENSFQIEEWEIHQKYFKKFESIAERIGTVKMSEKGKIKGKLTYLKELLRKVNDSRHKYSIPYSSHLVGTVHPSRVVEIVSQIRKKLISEYNQNMTRAVNFLADFCDYLIDILNEDYGL